MIRDLQISLRKLSRDQRFTATVVGTLALGIGAATAIFSVFFTVILRPLPYPGAERLVALRSVNRAQGVEDARASMGDFVDWRQRTDAFERLVAIGSASLVITSAGDPEEIPTAAVTTGFFELLGVSPVRGRGFLAEEETPGRDQVVVLGHGLWQRRFGGDPEIVGTSLVLSGMSFEVVGVMPPGFDFPSAEIEIWSPMALDREKLIRKRRGLDVLGLLRPGATPEEAQRELSAIAGRLGQEYPDTNAGWDVSVVSLRDHLVSGAGSALALLLGATSLLLLIACANIAHLMLMRAIGLQREVAIRTALGISRGALIRQYVIESLVLGLSGGALGVLLASWAVRLLVRASPHEVYQLHDAGIDGPVLLFALGLSIVTGLMVGVLPALRGLRLDVNSSLKDGGERAGGAGRLWASEALIVAEMAIALLLLIGSGLLIKSFARLTEVDPGFAPEKLLVVPVILPINKYPEEHQQAKFFDDLLRGLATLPAVASVATSSAVPMNSPALRLDLAFRIDGKEAASDQERRADVRLVSPGYLRTMGIDLEAGRDFTARDRPASPRVALLNEAAVKRYWRGESPVGDRVTLDYRGGASHEVVGVVGDVRSSGLDADPRPEIYLAATQYPFFFSTVVLRARTDPRRVIPSVKARVWAIDPEQPLSFSTMEEILARSVADRRFTMFLLGLFSVVSLVLTVIGVYGMMAAGVARRTNEIGIRVALGAGAGDLLWMIFKRGLILASLGVVLGSIVAYAASKLMSGFVYQIVATDSSTFALAIAVLFLAALAGASIPARRAMRLDPIRALRYE